jgi:hypothetical protein
MVDRFGKPAFGSQLLTLTLSSIVPQREPTLAMKRTDCYKQIATSLEHVGLIEPSCGLRAIAGHLLARRR